MMKAAMKKRTYAAVVRHVNVIFFKMKCCFFLDSDSEDGMSVLSNSCNAFYSSRSNFDFFSFDDASIEIVYKNTTTSESD